MKKNRIRPWLKVTLSTLLVLVLFVTSYLVSFTVFKEDSSDVFAQNISVSNSDTTCYYMKKASPDIIFHIRDKNSGDPYGYELTDVVGDEVEASVETSDDGESFDITPPNGGYKEGGVYTLILAEDTYFSDSDLKGARKLIFTIDRPEQESYKFTEKVVESGDELNLDSQGQLILPDNHSFRSGDIAFGQNSDGEYVAYKIEYINGNTASVSLPAFDEIYEYVNIYKNYEFDVSLLEKNPNLEREVLDNLVASDFYTDLMATAYQNEGNTSDEEKEEGSSFSPAASFTPVAASLSANDFEFTFETDKEENSATFSITIPINAGKSGVFGIEELSSHSIKLTISDTIKCNAFVDFKNAKEWDLSCNVTSDFSWSVDIELLNGEISEDPDLDDLFKKSKIAANHHQLVKQISQKLEQFSKDHGDLNLDLFEWKIPIASLPGVFFEAEIELPFSFEMCANVTVGNSQTITYVSGLCLHNKKFDSYSDEYTSKATPSFSIRGEATFKTGVQLETQLCFIDEDIAHLGVAPQAGVYCKIYALAPITGEKDFDGDGRWYAHLETGVYLQVEVDAYINLWGSNDLYFGPAAAEFEWAIPEGGWGNSEIPFGLEPGESVSYVENGRAAVPAFIFEYYDITDGIRKTRILEKGDYTLYNEDGDELRVSGGKIDVPDSVGEEGMLVRVKYKYEKDKVYETYFTATTSRSVIEGQVSAFNRGNYKTLANAKVTLYKADSPQESIASKITEADGKFKFNVAPGTYLLRISAHKYKTLTTTQTVGENETKYTEHLLLLDESMDGLGSASGTISDALNGRGISGATIKLRENWNNATGDYVDNFSTSTNSSGSYTIQGLPIGYYTLEATANGYVTTRANILVLDDRDLVDFDFAMTPHLEIGTVRIILNWGASPNDLDSHLVGKTPSGGTFNVYYADKEYYHNGTEMANLDYDDTSSYGPETITILEDVHGTYTYAVHDFSNKNSSSSNAMSYSGARVRVLIGGRDKVEEFYIPTNRIGTYWTVFSIDSDLNVTPINTVSNTKPTP